METLRLLLGFAIGVALIVFGVFAYREAALEADTSCPVTPRFRHLDVIAPMAGGYPVWMVDGSNGRWPGADVPIKTVWVVARDYPGDLVVTAKRLDGEEHARFLLSPQSDPEPVLIIPNAHETAMTPGGADPSVLRQVAFRSSAILYPSPGCWRLIAHLGDVELPIVVRID